MSLSAFLLSKAPIVVPSDDNVAVADIAGEEQAKKREKKEKKAKKDKKGKGKDTEVPAAPAAKIDTELDALFKSSAATIPTVRPPTPSIPAQKPVKSTVRFAAAPTSTQAASPKKRKFDEAAPGETSSGKTGKRMKKEGGKAGHAKAKGGDVMAEGKGKEKEEGMNVDIEDEVGQSAEENNSDLENAYYRSKQRRSTKSTETPSKVKGKGKKKTSGKLVEDSEADEEEDADDEGSDPDVDADVETDDAPDIDSEDSEDDPSALVHESLLNPPKKKRVPKKIEKYTPPEESKEQRDMRTIFVGNLTIGVAQKKSALKAFHRHILSQLPTAKIESTRFRSIAFSNPTSKLPAENDGANDGATATANKGKSPANNTTTTTSSSSDANVHGRARASAWKKRTGAGETNDPDESAVKKDEKQYLTPGQKKRIAFIHQNFHSGAETVTAYVVFGHALPSSGEGVVEEQEGSGKEGKKGETSIMNPYLAAKKAVGIFDNSLYASRILRVDLGIKGGIAGPLARSIASTLKYSSSSQNSSDQSSQLNDKVKAVDEIILPDPKLTVFVGNLDFESREEMLREYFEGVMVKERGDPDVVLGGENTDTTEKTGKKEKEKKHRKKGEEAEAEKNGGVIAEVTVGKIEKPKMWVTRVRIVRDKETQLGKGFAYVQFVDRQCVDEILAMEEGKLKFLKRKLRVQRCKTIPGVAASIRNDRSKSTNNTKGASAATNAGTSATKSPSHTQTQPRKAPVPISIPKGNPKLGEQLANLSKEKRKEIKAHDPDRVARRLAKKKARIGMADKGGVKVDSGAKGEKRERVRKPKGEGRESSAKRKEKFKSKKGRVRSDHSASKRNLK